MKIRQIALAALAMACLVPAAQATVISYTSNIIDLQDTNFTETLGLQQFNSALGHLNSVQIALYANATGGVTLTNLNDDTAYALPVSLNVKLWLNDAGNHELVAIDSPLFNTALDVASGASATASGSYSGSALSSVFTSNLGMFTGNGSFAAYMIANAFTNTSGDGILAEFSTQAGGYGKVTYDYTAAVAAVPEPETYGMLLTGLGLMGVVARRKKATQANA